MASHSLSYSLFTPDLEKNLVIQSNYITSSIILSYILFSKVIGPSMMKNRKPMDLKLLILAYNTALVASNVYLSNKITKAVIQLWPYRCDIRNSPLHQNMSMFYNIAWGCFFVKFAELLDTVFFILRKKFNQVSFLHVFHHSVVCFMYWICLKYQLTGYYILVIGSINCSIHVLLYLYYALSAFGPEVRKYLWWKKYLTTLQIMQFFVLMAYMVYSFFNGCEEFGYYDRAVLTGTVFITVLFLNFYFQTYLKSKRT